MAKAKVNQVKQVKQVTQVNPIFNPFEPQVATANIKAIEEGESLVFALFNSAGNVGKSTMVHLLSNPMINFNQHGLQRPAWLNVDEENTNSFKTEVIDLSKSLDESFLAKLTAVVTQSRGIRDVAVDAGSGNSMKVLGLMSNKSIDSLVDRYVVPLVVTDQEVISDALNTVAGLQDAGVDLRKVRVIPNMVTTFLNGIDADLSAYEEILSRFSAVGVPVDHSIFIPHEKLAIELLRKNYGLTPLEAMLRDYEIVFDGENTDPTQGFAFNRYMADTSNAEAERYFNMVLAAKELMLNKLTAVKAYVRGAK